jgi:hypothetical protein
MNKNTKKLDKQKLKEPEYFSVLDLLKEHDVRIRNLEEKIKDYEDVLTDDGGI